MTVVKLYRDGSGARVEWSNGARQIVSPRLLARLAPNEAEAFFEISVEAGEINLGDRRDRPKDWTDAAKA